MCPRCLERLRRNAQQPDQRRGAAGAQCQRHGARCARPADVRRLSGRLFARRRQLADDAHEFRNTALDRGASDPDTKAAFRRVSRSYLLVRDEAEHSDSHDVRADLKPVTDAYLDVEREMGGYPSRRASADD